MTVTPRGLRAVNKLAKLLVSPATSKTGTPLRYARGVVVSSNMGQSVVTLDGGATNVTAFNYGHAQSLPAGTVVDVRVDGTKLYVIGAYPNQIPVGGLIAQSSSVTVTGAVVAGSTYAFSAFALGTQHTSNAIVTLTMTTDDSVISATIGEGLVTAGYQFSGSRTTLYTPATTRTTTFAVTYSTTAGTFSIAGGEVMVVRVS